MADNDQQANKTISVAPPVGTPGALPAVTATPPPVVVPEDMDETTPGGRYVVGGETVDAEGRSVTDQGKK